MEKVDVFKSIYPFATENVKECLKVLNIKDKTVLTVGSSLDQTFNAITMGASKITVFDINPYAFDFFKLKKDIILSTDRSKLFDIMTSESKLKEMTSIDVSLSKDFLSRNQIYSINDYLESDEKYQLLKDKLATAKVDFITGDIFKMDEVLGDKKYDRIILSNILQYIQYYFIGQNPYEILSKGIKIWDKYLTNDGILQLLYLYSFGYEDLVNENHPIATYNIRKVYDTLKSYKLDIEWITGTILKDKDAIVTCQKRKSFN